MRTRVVPVPLSISNAYLLLGDRPVLVDTGVAGEEARLAGALRAHGVAPQDLALIALTHGHTDHAGSVNGVAAGGVPVAIGAGDAGLLRAGVNGVLPATGPAGVLLRPYIRRMTFGGAVAKIEVTEPPRLEPWGVSGVMVPAGGHTPGSCVLLLDGGDAVIGDLARGGFASGRIRPGYPLRHYFAEDAEGFGGPWTASWPGSRPGCSPAMAARSARTTSGAGSTPSRPTARKDHDHD